MSRRPPPASADDAKPAELIEVDPSLLSEETLVSVTLKTLAVQEDTPAEIKQFIRQLEEKFEKPDSIQTLVSFMRMNRAAVSLADLAYVQHQLSDLFLSFMDVMFKDFQYLVWPLSRYVRNFGEVDGKRVFQDRNTWLMAHFSQLICDDDFCERAIDFRDVPQATFVSLYGEKFGPRLYRVRNAYVMGNMESREELFENHFLSYARSTFHSIFGREQGERIFKERNRVFYRKMESKVFRAKMKNQKDSYLKQTYNDNIFRELRKHRPNVFKRLWRRIFHTGPKGKADAPIRKKKAAVGGKLARHSRMRRRKNIPPQHQARKEVGLMRLADDDEGEPVGQESIGLLGSRDADADAGAGFPLSRPKVKNLPPEKDLPDLPQPSVPHGDDVYAVKAPPTASGKKKRRVRKGTPQPQPVIADDFLGFDDDDHHHGHDHDGHHHSHDHGHHSHDHGHGHHDHKHDDYAFEEPDDHAAGAGVEIGGDMGDLMGLPDDEFESMLEKQFVPDGADLGEAPELAEEDIEEILRLGGYDK